MGASRDSIGTEVRRAGSERTDAANLFTPASFRRRVFLGGAPSGLHPRSLQIAAPTDITRRG